jgi:hypothetical protein
MSVFLKTNKISSSGIKSLNFSTSIVKNGLILHVDAADIDSYPGSGTSWYDLSDFRMTGTTQSGVSYSSSNTGVLSFDTSANAYVQFLGHQLTNFRTDDFSLEMWIYPTSLSSYTHMFAMPDQGTFALKAEVTTGNIYFYSGGVFGTYGSTPGWTLSINAWNHVVMVRRSSVAYCYLNGQMKGKVTGFTNDFNGQALNIGAGWPNERPTKQVSQARVYNKGLVSAEVLNNYYATKGRFGL